MSGESIFLASCVIGWWWRMPENNLISDKYKLILYTYYNQIVKKKPCPFTTLCRKLIY